MLKTAILTLGFAVLATNALAVETHQFDRKIERAAMERAAMKMGGLRETLEVEIKIAVADVAALPVELDLAPTAAVAPQLDESRFAKPVEAKQFRIIAGEYNR